jgi:hypothetical protein
MSVIRRVISIHVLVLAAVLVLGGLSAWPQIPPLTGLPPRPFISSVAWSADGSRLATGTALDAAKAKVWDAETGRELLTLGLHGSFRASHGARMGSGWRRPMMVHRRCGTRRRARNC